MKIAIRYYTRSGNTERLAKAISSELLVEAKTVEENLEEKVDILFLGCSYYAFDVDESVKKFVEENREKIGKIVCFGTSAMMRSMQKPMKKVARANSVELAEKDFHCRGEFGPFFKGQPNADDIAAAINFVKKIVEE